MRKQKYTKLPLPVLILLLIVIAVVQYISSLQAEPPLPPLTGDEIRVHFVDIGQGDCAVVESEFGNILIDAGPPECERDLLHYLDENRLTEFEYAFFTHPHSDHIGSATAVLNTYKVKNVVLGNGISTGGIYKRLLQTLDAGGQKVMPATPGDVITLGEIKIEIVAPVKTYEDLNNSSIVFRLSYGNFSALFTGDAEHAAEYDILQSGADISAVVLKVGHHGSSTSTSEEFLRAVSPKVAVISLAEDNSYGHPHREILRRLSEYGVEVFRTDMHGSIVLTTDGTSFQILTEE